MKVVRWVLALVFAVAGGAKIGGMWRGGDDQTIFGGMPLWVQWLAVAAEMGLALWMVSGWRVRLGAFVAITALSLFLGVILIEMGKEVPRDCGCLGAMKLGNGREGLWEVLGMDGVLLGGGGGSVFSRGRMTTD